MNELICDLVSECSIVSAPSCDHFGRQGEWEKYLATKVLAKVANWRPTDLKRNLLEKLSKIPDKFNQ